MGDNASYFVNSRKSTLIRSKDLCLQNMKHISHALHPQDREKALHYALPNGPIMYPVAIHSGLHFDEMYHKVGKGNPFWFATDVWSWFATLSCIRTWLHESCFYDSPSKAIFNKYNVIRAPPLPNIDTSILNCLSLLPGMDKIGSLTTWFSLNVREYTVPPYQHHD